MAEYTWWLADQWPDIAEWHAIDAYYPGEGRMIGNYYNGEHSEEFDTFALGARVAAFLEGENPPYPGWYPG